MHVFNFVYSPLENENVSCSDCIIIQSTSFLFSGVLKLQRELCKFPENTWEQLSSVCEFVSFVLPLSSCRFDSETLETKSHSHF